MHCIVCILSQSRQVCGRMFNLKHQNRPKVALCICSVAIEISPVFKATALWIQNPACVAAAAVVGVNSKNPLLSQFPECRIQLFSLNKESYIRRSKQRSYRTRANKGHGFYSKSIFSALYNGAFCKLLTIFYNTCLYNIQQKHIYFL